MTHSHALDLAIVERPCAIGRFPYVGLIGSATKRARFVSAPARRPGLPESEFAGFVCPIGIGGHRARKVPAVIAAATAAELLARDEHAESRMESRRSCVHKTA